MDGRFDADFPREHGSTGQRAILRGGAGLTPPVGEPGVDYYMGNTKIATMFASHGASESADGLRWTIG